MTDKVETLIEQYRELFEQEIYRFQPSQQSPVIVDTTVNVGLSVLYFKDYILKAGLLGSNRIQIYIERWRITVEPLTYKMLSCSPQAVGTCSTVLKLDREDLTPGDCDEDIEVPALRLKDFLSSKVDLLKLEIKGCKTDVLLDCDEALQNVNNVFVLYRSSPREPQAVDLVTRILKDAGFRLHIYGEPQSPRPFLWRKVGWGTDMALKIFAFRA